MSAKEPAENNLKEELLSDLNLLLSKINHPGGLRRFILMVLERKPKKGNEDDKDGKDIGYSRFSFEPLIDDIKQLLRKVKSSESDDLDEERADKVKLENKYKRVVIWPNIISGIIYISLGLIAFFLLRHFNIYSLLTDSSRETKYYLVGIAGTILYYAIKIVKSERRKDKVQLLFARLTITLIACCILLISLDTADKENFALKDEGKKILLFFVCGYSVEIVIEFINKIIEKVTGMIDSI